MRQFEKKKKIETLPTFNNPFRTDIKQITPRYLSYHESNKSNDNSPLTSPEGLKENLVLVAHLVLVWVRG